MSYTKKIAINTAAQMIGKAAGVAVAIVSTAVLFRYFGVEGVGEYTTVFAFAGFFSVFADFGLQWTLIRELAVQSDKNKVFRNIFSVRIILAAVIHALCFAAVWFFNYPYAVKIGVGVISAAWFFTTMNSTLVGVFFNNFKVYISVSTELLGKLVILAGVIILTRSHQSFSVVMTSYLVANFVNFAASAFMARKYVNLGFAWDKAYIKHVISQTVPIGLVLVFGFIYFKIDSILLSLMKGMTDVGIYGTAYKLLEVLQGVPTMFLGAAFPLVTRYVIKNDKRMHLAFQKQFDFLMLVALPLVIGVYVLANPIISFIGGTRGTEFVGASTVSFLGNPATSVTVLRILIFSVGINFLSNLYSYLVVSLGKQKAMVIPVILFAVFNIIANVLVIPKFSYFGSAVATLLTEIIVFTTYYSVSRKFARLPIRFSAFMRILICALTLGVVCWYLDRLGINLFLNITFATLLYIALVIILKVVPADLIKSLAHRED